MSYTIRASKIHQLLKGMVQYYYYWYNEDKTYIRKTLIGDGTYPGGHSVLHQLSLQALPGKQETMKTKGKQS